MARFVAALLIVLPVSHLLRQAQETDPGIVLFVAIFGVSHATVIFLRSL